MPGWLKLVASLALAGGLLAWLFLKMDGAKLAATVRACNGWWLVAAVGGSSVYWLVRTARWRWTTSLVGAPVSWRIAGQSMLAGLGIGLLTPMRGGEIVRPLFVPPGARPQLAGFVVLEKCFDLAAVLLLAVPGLAWLVAQGILPPWAAWTAGGLLLAAAIPLAILMLRPRGLFLLIERRLPAKLRSGLQITLPWRTFGIMLAASFLAEGMSIFTVYLCFRSLGSFDLATAFSFVPLVMLNNLIPFTPGGLGLRETIAKYVFLPLGYADTLVVTAYLVNTAIVLLAPGLLGLLLAWRVGVFHRVRTGQA